MASPVPYEAPTSEAKTYTGVCHCQATKFTVHQSTFEAAEYCNCRYCKPKDILWLRPIPDQLHWERQGSTTKYEFAKKSATFEFCSTCGIFIRVTNESDGSVVINARLLENIDFWELKRNPQCDFASVPDSYEPPVFNGPAFDSLPLSSDNPSKKLYHGNCHCGAVTIAMLTTPLSQQKIIECNCSYCVRWSSIYAYPPSTDVHIGNFDALSSYSESRFGWYGRFCRICGEQILITRGRVTDKAGNGWREDLRDGSRAKLGYDDPVVGVNLRVFRDVDWEDVEAKRLDGRAERGSWEVR